MIKRPLVWIFCAYLAGMYLAWQKLSIEMIIIISLFLALAGYLLMYRITNPLMNHRDKFIWCLPFLLLLGFGSMRGQLAEPKLNAAFEQKVSCELSGRITMIVKKQWGQAIYVKDNTITLPGEKQYICENVIVFCYTNQQNPPVKTGIEKQDKSLSGNYLVGNRINVLGTLQKFLAPTNPGQFNEKLYYQIENIDYKLTAKKIELNDASYSVYHAYLDKIKSRLLSVYENILPEKESGTLIAMLLGEKYLLDEEIKQLYQINGISHILAISGLHVSLIGMAVFWLLKKCRLPIPIATFLSIFIIYSYGVLTNFSVSTNRAVVMMVVLLLAALFGKTYDMLSALALSAFLILLQNPLQILSAGFLLSFGAVFGIAVILPCFKKLFPSKNYLVGSLLMSTCAQITTTPFILYFFYQFPVYSILTNLIILPFVTVLTLTSILAGMAGVIWLPVGIFMVGGAEYILKFYELVCRIVSRLPKNLLTVGRPGILKIVIYFLLLAVFVWIAGKYKKWYSILIPAAAFLLLLMPHANDGFEVTVLDVGQGDSIYMESENGTTFLVDGGSVDVKRVGMNRIQPFLLSQGTDCIDFAVVTHSDSDHISGLTELMELGKIHIRNLILPYINKKDDAYLSLELLAKEKNIAVKYIKAGDHISEGKLRLLCLHPAKGFEASTNNSYSTVLSVTYGEFDMLLTGDLEQGGEDEVLNLLKNQELMQKYYDMKDGNGKTPTDYDVLKVAHHGSKNSTFMDLLKVIRPEYSMISCGRDNSYGHPNKELLNRLNKIGSEILITYETGAITIRTDGKIMKIDNVQK